MSVSRCDQQDAAAAVAAMSRELSDMADRLLPGEEGGGGRGPRLRGAAADTAAAPLQQRLQESWQGKVPADPCCCHPVSHDQHNGDGNQLTGETPSCSDIIMPLSRTGTQHGLTFHTATSSAVLFVSHATLIDSY